MGDASCLHGGSCKLVAWLSAGMTRCWRQGLCMGMMMPPQQQEYACRCGDHGPRACCAIGRQACDLTRLEVGQALLQRFPPAALVARVPAKAC